LPSTFGAITIVVVVDVAFVVLGDADDPCQHLADAVRPHYPRDYACS
jgi:hypothetical protein